MALLPGLARHQRADDRRDALRAGVGDELPQVPAVAVHDLGLLRQQVVDRLGLLAHALDRAASARGVVERAVVVVPELHDHVVARLEQRQRALPVALRQEGAAAQPADGAVDEIHPGRIEIGAEVIAPPPLSALAVTATVAHGRIADEHERRQLRVRRLREVQPADAVGRDGLALRGEKGAEGTLADALQAGDNLRGVEIRPGRIGVRMVRTEKCLHLLLAALLVIVGHHAGQVDERDARRLRQLAIPLAVVAGAALHDAVFPDVAHSQREHDRRRPAFLYVGNHSPDVPAEGVHDLVLPRDDIVDFHRLIAQPGQRTARAHFFPRHRGILVDRAAVVVAELDEDVVAGLQFGQQLLPQALADVGAATASAARAVGDVDLGRVEIVRKRHAPTLGWIAVVLRGGRVARDEDRRQRGVERGDRGGGIGVQVGCGGLREGGHGQQEQQESAEFHGIGV